MKYILFLGRIHEIKGIDILVKVFNVINNKKYILVIAGPCTGALKKYLEEKSTGNIIWLDTVHGAEKSWLLSNAEMFILPSHHENFGIAVAEALSFSLPVIISDRVNIYQKIIEYNAGFVCEDKYESVLEYVLKWIELTPRIKAEMKNNARLCFEKEFDINNSVDDLIKIIKSSNAKIR